MRKSHHGLMAGGSRLFVGLLLALTLFFNSIGTLYAAGTVGAINGNITDATTGAGIANVTVTAVSPTGTYKTTTDAKGFYSIVGVQPDTYTIAFSYQGYSPQSTSGLTVNADQTSGVSVKLTKESTLKTIGKVTSRSEGSAFQPKQTQDSYTVTAKQAQELLGKTDALSETNLITRLPGASLDRSGYPVIRGGRENDEGFLINGIPAIDAFTSQFTNSLSLNAGLNQLQLTPGAGDSSVGGAGTGTLNLITKRGSYPSFASVDFESVLQPYDHQLSLEFGTATKNGAVSNYFQFTGYNSGTQVGSRGVDVQSLSLGTFEDTAYNTSREFSDNFILKFGKNQSQSFQAFYDSQQTNFLGTLGTTSLTYPAGDPYYLANLENYTSLNQAQLQSPSIYGLLPFQTSLTGPLGTRGATNYYQPQNILKFGYTANIGDRSFLQAQEYTLDSVSTFDFPYSGGNIGFGSFSALQGGHRTGGTIDFTSNINAQHTAKIGVEYDFLHPVYDQSDPQDGLYSVSGFGPGYALGDFINPALPAGAAGDGLGNCPLGADANGTSYCGYLYNYLKNPGPVPNNEEQTVTNESQASIYATDKYQPTKNLVLDYGVRVESANYRLPSLAGCNPTSLATQTDTCQYLATGTRTDAAGETLPVTTLSNQVKKPLVFEPRIAASFQLTPNDAIRASFARSAQFAPLAFIDVTNANVYGRYANIPSYDAVANLNAGTLYAPPAAGAFTGAGNPYQAMTCGVTGNLPCQNYADQLRWLNQNAIEGVPIQPVRPTTFSNFDFSYSHQFSSGVAVKVTPFYRRGYDVLALVAQPRIAANGQPVLDPNTGSVVLNPAVSTNLGTNHTTGVEFQLTREVANGLSAGINATYINEFSNVLPSPLITEDFFPSILTQSILLGNQYRVGFVSPLSGVVFLNYRTKGGFRINPIVTYTRGYPAGVGDVTPAFVNGKAVNIPLTNSSPETAPYGQNYSSQFVDPQNPGSVFKPNIAATRGTYESSSAAGFLTNPRFRTDISVEYSPPGTKSTFGVQITNLFNQIYSGVPAYNSRYQPVATGVSGPKTGYSTTPVNFPELGSQQYLPFQYGNDPYRIVPNATPQLIRLYYQLAI